jgi:hypothetical protein
MKIHWHQHTSTGRQAGRLSCIVIVGCRRRFFIFAAAWQPHGQLRVMGYVPACFNDDNDTLSFNEASFLFFEQQEEARTRSWLGLIPARE